MPVPRSHPLAVVLFALLAVASLLSGAAPPVRAAEPAPWPTQGWPTSTPEAQGMRSADLARLIDFGAANGMDSLLVTRHGRLVAEATYAPYRPGLTHAINSATKAIVGTLVGMAVQDGMLQSIEQPVLAFFPERGKDAGMDARKKMMTVSHLLNMNSGIDWQEHLDARVPETLIQLERNRDWIGFVLDRPMAQAPGAGFNYSSGNSHLLSAILARQTGGDTRAYAQRRLFMPLGISAPRWRQDPQGLATGGFGLYLQPRDMAKIGYLYLRRGQWEERQLLPATWVDDVFNASLSMNQEPGPGFNYAKGWWTIPEKQAFMAVGFNRQLIVVLPALDVVAVATGRRNYPFAPLIDGLIGSASSVAALPPDAPAQALLAASIQSAATEKTNPVAAAPELAAAISGKTYRFARNALGLKAFTLDLSPASPSYEIVAEARAAGAEGTTVRGDLGLDGHYRVDDRKPDALVAVKGEWTDGQTLRIFSRMLQDGRVAMYQLRFEGKTVDVVFENNTGFMTKARGETD